VYVSILVCTSWRIYRRHTPANDEFWVNEPTHGCFDKLRFDANKLAAMESYGSLTFIDSVLQKAGYGNGIAGTANDHTGIRPNSYKPF
jgi:hypothetical protein